MFISLGENAIAIVVILMALMPARAGAAWPRDPPPPSSSRTTGERASLSLTKAKSSFSFLGERCTSCKEEF